MLPSMNPRILVLGLDRDADYLRTYTDAVRDGGARGGTRFRGELFGPVFVYVDEERHHERFNR